MNNPLRAAHYADDMLQKTVEISVNKKIARDTYLLRFICPEMASRFGPGQFLMVRIHDCDDPLIGRPLALYDIQTDAAGQPHSLDVVYLAKGKFTQHLKTMQPGQHVDVWGPLGNGFALDTEPGGHLLMVVGGIGQTPMLALAKAYRQVAPFRTVTRNEEPAGNGKPGNDATLADHSSTRLTLLYGARTSDYLAGLQQFRDIGVEVATCTDDGTDGREALVTELLEDTLRDPDDQPSSIRIVCCGPEPMMARVAEIAAQHNLPCQVSLETPMACGIGICFTCVARIRVNPDTHAGNQDADWDYKRTCVEGPVFPANSVVF